MDSYADELLKLLSKHDCKGQTISVERLPLLKREIEEFYSQGLFDKEFYRERLSWLNFELPESLPRAKSIIVIATPRPQTRAIFNLNGQRRPLIIPPTYTGYDRVREQIEDLLAKTISREKYTLTRTTLPLKLLAARSGLAQYGRNNICYVQGMGSFLQLAAVYSDMPCEEDNWQEKTVMESCEECERCRRACPSGAIPSDRFLLRAERCIVYHNEKKGDISFPEWVDASWHNCIVGCMHCQRACPENRKFIEFFDEEEEFSEEETKLLLNDMSGDRLPARTRGKLERLSLIDYLDSLQRNLGVFFNKHK
ncbi:MAG: Epoxyqueuosine reductase [Thermoproteota archaeon]|nr:Epoxyqueuosine reductase [Thermoproteota archaeon]